MFLVVVLAFPAATEGCSCRRRTLKQQANAYSDVMKLTVLSGPVGYRPKNQMAGRFLYTARVSESFKGSTEEGDFILLETAVNSALCGTSVSRGTKLVTVSKSDMPGVFRIDLCGYRKPWKKVKAREKSIVRNL